MYICLRCLSRCNWDCPYCTDLTGMKYKLPDENIILNKIDQIINFCGNNHIYEISGGEPTLLSQNFFNNLLSLKKKYSCKFKLFTNGTDFNKVPNDLFDIIIYHITEEISKGIDVEKLDMVKQRFKCVNKVVIVHRYNLEYLEEFVKKYKDLDIYYIISDTNDRTWNLDLDQIIQCIKIFRKYNIDEKYFSSFSRYFNFVINRRKYNRLLISCKININKIKIDLEKDIIIPCCRSLNNRGYKFSYELLNMYLNNDVCLHLEDCKECYYLYNLEW